MMAGDEFTFEDINWTDIDKIDRSYRPETIIAWASLLAIAGTFVYDYIYRSGLPTFEFESVPVIGRFTWQVSQVDWLFLLTLLALWYYAVVPLYRDKRLTEHYWRQFRKNRAAVVSLVYLIIIFGIGTIGPLVLSKPEANFIAGYQPPVGFSVKSSVPIECMGEVVGGRCHGSVEHPLGTTRQGKDILVSVIYGMRVSMQIGLIATLITIVMATVVGTVAAYHGGAVDEILMRYVDIQITFPTFFLYLLLVYLLGGSLFLMIIIFGLLGWGGIARIVRSEALQRREEEYIMASKNVGANTLWVIRKHLVPNVSNSVITAATLLIPFLILTEAALSFLQLGDPTIPSWGQLIAEGRSDLGRAWWISTLPGFFLFFTILAFNFLGDALRDALDPRHAGDK